MRVFVVCQSMKWAHLPLPGGLYDQHPKLIDQFQILWQEMAKEEKAKQDRQKRSKGKR